MAALDFPQSPIGGDRYPVPPVAGIPTYTWDGEKWTTSGPGIITSGGAVAPPLPDGVSAVVGVSNKFAREDHVHPETIVLPVAASTAQFLANSAPDQGKMLTPGAAWGAAGLSSLAAVTGNVTPDMSLAYNFVWNATANTTFKNPTNQKNGQAGIILIVQDGTGGRLITWDTAWKFPNGTKPLLSTAANSYDVVSYICTGNPALVLCSFQKDLK
jgi:hypothetical protein